MLRTIFWFIYFWYYLIASYPKLLKVKKYYRNGQLEEMKELIFKTSRHWARSLIKLTGSTVEVSGQENLPKDQSFVVISNHQGNFDIPIIIGYLERPIGFISKIEVKKLPIIRDWMVYMNCVFLDRSDRRKAINSINQGAEKIKEGNSIVIFPEGTRSKGMNMNPFKPGSFKLAEKSGAPIVPVVIKGSFKIMEQNGYKMKPAHVKVTILPYISKEQYKDKDIKEISEDVRELIFKELQK